MLTATYTLVTLAVEQTRIRVGLQSLRQMLHAYYVNQGALSAAQVEHATGTMHKLHDACHWRKSDKFLIPAVRRATRLADDLLAELDALSAQSGDALAVSGAFGGAIDDVEQVDAFCAVVDSFCAAWLARLDREEQALFPLARAAVTGEAWFALANQLLAHDAYLQEQRSEQAPAIPRRHTWRARPGPARPGARLNTLH